MSADIVLGSAYHSDSLALDSCKIYQPESLSHPDLSWTHQYLSKGLPQEDSYLEKLKKQKDQSTDVLKRLVQDIRFMTNKPSSDSAVHLKDWTPTMKHEEVNQDGVKFVLKSEEADEIRLKICNILKQAGVDTSKIDDDQLQDFNERLQHHLSSKVNADVIGSDANHYKFLQTTSEEISDEKMEKIKKYLDEGFGDRIVLSHNITNIAMDLPASSLRPSSVILDIVPRLSRRSSAGDAVHKVVLDNPKTWLTFDR